jgi:hypothetical protein
VDTLAFPDSNVWKIEIKPALDPNYPNEPGEYMGWQAQFERNPEILLDCGKLYGHEPSRRPEMRREVRGGGKAANDYRVVVHERLRRPHRPTGGGGQ